jgi:hypothetical protein
MNRLGYTHTESHTHSILRRFQEPVRAGYEHEQLAYYGLI